MNGCKKCPAYAKCTETYRGSGCAALRYTYGLDSDPKLDCTDREKLIEILKVPIYPHLDADPAEVVADYLLDNGVTFAKDTDVPSKWISVEERLPEEGEVVMCYHKALEYPVVCHWDESDLCWVNNDWTFGRGLITHWMPLPEPPKEV